MEILTELGMLIQQGLYVTILVMFLFYFIPYNSIKAKWLKETLTRITIIAAAFFIVWLTNQLAIWEWTKALWKEALIALAFSSLFYEFAGKFVVRKWFSGYSKT